MSPRKKFYLILFSLLLLLTCSLSFFFLDAKVNNNSNRRVAIESKPVMTPKMSPKPHFVLVHGFRGGAWAWFKIQALLEASGYNVTSIDLRGSGIDPTNSSSVLTFHDYNKPLVDFFAKLPDDEKVILVGYSAGGVSVTDISHRFSKKIKLAIYVAATMLKHGFVTKHDIEMGAPAGKMEAKLHNETTKINCPTSTIFQEVLSRILNREIPMEAITSARFEGRHKGDRVKRVYIKTMCDQTLLPEKQQAAMIHKWPPSKVILVESDHQIIFSQPLLLAGFLFKLAICD